MSPNRDGTSVALIKTIFNDAFGYLSPDGRYLANYSNPSGQDEVYVKSFPEGENEWQISDNGGQWPRWSPKGNELFYLEKLSNSFMTVKVESGSGFEKGSPRKLFTMPEGVELDNSNLFRLYDVAADGQRFLMTRSVGETSQNEATITVVQNWAKEFEGRE